MSPDVRAPAHARKNFTASWPIPHRDFAWETSDLLSRSFSTSTPRFTAMDRSSLPAASISIASDAPAVRDASTAQTVPMVLPPPVPPRPLADPKASRIFSVLLKLLPYEDALREWSAADGANARLFMRNPLEAAAAANLGLPPSLLEELRTVSSLIGGPSPR